MFRERRIQARKTAFIWVIVAAPDACCVEERDEAAFRINAHLFDNKTDAEITDCVTQFKVLCSLWLMFFVVFRTSSFHFYLHREWR